MEGYDNGKDAFYTTAAVILFSTDKATEEFVQGKRHTVQTSPNDEIP